MLSILRSIISCHRLRGKRQWEKAAEEIKQENGFDPIAHEEMREEIRSGKIMN